MQTILVVEDEASIALLIKVYLEKAGYQAQIACDGLEAMASFVRFKPILVLLDLMLPEKDGWAVLEDIRKQSSCPVIMITARGAVEDRLKGLNRGADDYIAKPFDPDEVVARVQAVLRRPARLIEPNIVRIDSLAMDFTARTVSIRGISVPLTPRDWDLLAFLVRHPNKVFTRDQLLDYVWGSDYCGADRAVDTAVKRIRQSLRDWPSDEGEITTIRGAGYLLRVKER